MKTRRWSHLTGIGGIFLLTGVAWPDIPSANEPAAQPEDVIVVFGRALSMIGKASAGSEGTVGYSDFERRPLSRVGELVDVIPGLIATQHSGWK